MTNAVLGEVKAMAYFIEKGYDVFSQFSGKSSFDFVVHKDGVLSRVEVKTTSVRSRSDTGWEVQIKRVRPNRTTNNVVGFDVNSCDFLCIYIEPIDRIISLPSSGIKAKNMITIIDSQLMEGQANR